MLWKTIISLLFVFSLFIVRTEVSAVSFPKPAGYINDFAGLYSAGFKTNLEESLSAYDKQTGSEFAVVTINTLDGNDIDTYAPQLFENWKIGKKGQDNGLLLLISKNDRKVRIEVGYGLEPYITDARVGDIIRNVITPEFRGGNYEKGTLSAITQLETYITNKDVAPQDNSSVSGSTQAGDGISGWAIVGVIIAIYSLITYAASFLGRTKEIWPGAAIGGVLGAIGGLIFAAVLGLVIGAVIFGAFGLFLDFILTKNYKVRKSKGLSTGFWGSAGGFGGGGGGGGGGFGGFGGGGSGGGGSSSGW